MHDPVCSHTVYCALARWIDRHKSVAIDSLPHKATSSYLNLKSKWGMSKNPVLQTRQRQRQREEGEEPGETNSNKMSQWKTEVRGHDIQPEPEKRRDKSTEPWIRT